VSCCQEDSSPRFFEIRFRFRKGSFKQLQELLEGCGKAMGNSKEYLPMLIIKLAGLKEGGEPSFKKGLIQWEATTKKVIHSFAGLLFHLLIRRSIR